jgi:uncharacterized protein with HEPN domain
MLPEGRDLALLHDMLCHARMAVRFTQGLQYADFLSDDTTRFAVERVVEIFGEAARHISKPFSDAHPEIPWRLIIAQRHVLAHDYGVLDHEAIWRVCTTHVPALILALEPLMPPPPTDPPSSSVGHSPRE